MCGRYRLSRRKQILEEHFDTADWQDDWSPRYNIAPTQPVPVIRQHPKEPVRQISTMRWGLIPYWAKDQSAGASTINARSETAAAKPAFRDPLRYRRCLIPADAFYEWKRTATGKQPYCFEVNEGELFAFAGLWDGWKDANGNWIRTCSIFDDDSKRCDINCPRQNASYPRSRQLQSLARSGHDQRAGRLGTVESLRCSDDAVLSGEHADQPCGER